MGAWLQHPCCRQPRQDKIAIGSLAKVFAVKQFLTAGAPGANRSAVGIPANLPDTY